MILYDHIRYCRLYILVDNYILLFDYGEETRVRPDRHNAIFQPGIKIRTTLPHQLQKLLQRRVII